ncbi:MAG: hypothetical protein ACOC12_04995 [Bacteroidota bacterium]
MPDNVMENMQEHLEQMEPKERLDFVVKVLPYMMPKYESVSFTFENNNPEENSFSYTSLKKPGPWLQKTKMVFPIFSKLLQPICNLLKRKTLSFLRKTGFLSSGDRIIRPYRPHELVAEKAPRFEPGDFGGIKKTKACQRKS